ncbi:MAG: hypothetical protein KBF88_16755 [Polyangiaceae bacterium]|nr:hypothetical protein [Polyangiaceae bacterium]
MKTNVWTSILASTFAAVLVAQVGVAGDPPKGAAGTVSTLAVPLEGFKWGMSRKDVVKVHNQVGGVFDKDFQPVMQKLQPGIRMQAVEAERETAKLAFERSWIEFKDTPVGYDATPLKGEYSYKNKEAVQVLTRAGKRRFFFYFGDPGGERLWKIYDEVPFSDTVGANYNDAVKKTNGLLGGIGAHRPADAAKGFSTPYVSWSDATTHFRLVDRTSEGMVGMVLEDKSVLGALPQLRSNKVTDPMSIDPTIAALTKSGVSDPNAKVDAGAPLPKKKGK